MARQRGNALKLAVAVPVDYFENTAQEMLRGVADAQTEFNQNKGKNERLLEIVIANDGNEPAVTKEVAKELAAEPDILGIIGHDSSESSKAALTIYENKGLAMISATSTSSKLKSDVLFRTVAPTTEAAKTYARYIRNNLGLDKVIIFYYLDSIYSTSLKEDFSKEFSKLRGEVRTVSLIAPPQNIEKAINQAIQQNIKLGFLIPSVKTDSIATAISRRNPKLKFFEEKDLTRNSKGMILSGPCLAEQSKSRYMKEATKKWETDISATTAASYDATQALIEAINRSSNNPTREEILNNLKSVTLPVGKTSGFGLEWSKENPLDHFNAKRNYCIY
jgi:ABC-type branched-subunit amino acid transport system substrate-binding protein